MIASTLLLGLALSTGAVAATSRPRFAVVRRAGAALEQNVAKPDNENEVSVDATGEVLAGAPGE